MVGNPEVGASPTTRNDRSPAAGRQGLPTVWREQPSPNHGVSGPRWRLPSGEDWGRNDMRQYRKLRRSGTQNPRSGVSRPNDVDATYQDLSLKMTPKVRRISRLTPVAEGSLVAWDFAPAMAGRPWALSEVTFRYRRLTAIHRGYS